MELKCRDLSLSLDRVAVMGVLNVTPDSFSDGGLWLEPDVAIKHALEMIAQGAAVIDVGGESTRPGAEAVSEDEELRRVLPVIEGLVAAAPDIPVSIDTRKPEVAAKAIEAGASIVNDTTGETSDKRMDALAAATGAAICIMHSRGTPATMRELTEYEDVVTDVRSFLVQRARELEAGGVGRESIVLDPGIGFAKNPRQNLELIKRMDEITSLRHPILVGTSRKSFIGAVLDLPEDERIEGTLATIVAAVLAGARIVRVHDVGQSVRAVRMTEAIEDPGSVG